MFRMMLQGLYMYRWIDGMDESSKKKRKRHKNKNQMFELVHNVKSYMQAI